MYQENYKNVAANDDSNDNGDDDVMVHVPSPTWSLIDAYLHPPPPPNPHQMSKSQCVVSGVTVQFFLSDLTCSSLRER